MPLARLLLKGATTLPAILTDDLSWVVGKHQLKLGGEFRKAQLDEFYHRHGSGERSPSTARRARWYADPTYWRQHTVGIPDNARWSTALADFLAGSVQNLQSIALGDPDRQVFVNTFDVFAQDAFPS